MTSLSVGGRDVNTAGDTTSDILGSGGDATLSSIDASGDINATSADGKKSLGWNSEAGSLNITGNLNVTGNVNINDDPVEPLHQVKMTVDTVMIRDLVLDIAYRNNETAFTPDEKQADRGIRVNRLQGGQNEAFFGSKYISDNIITGDRFYYRIGTEIDGVVGDSEFRHIYCERITSKNLGSVNSDIKLTDNDISINSPTLNLTSNDINITANNVGGINLTSNNNNITINSGTETTNLTSSTVAISSNATVGNTMEITGLLTANGGIICNTDKFILDTNGNATINGELNVDNLSLDGNIISSTDVNGAINITPNGTGSVIISSTIQLSPTPGVINTNVLDISSSVIIISTSQVDLKLPTGTDGQIIYIINTSASTIKFHDTDSNVAEVGPTTNNTIDSNTCIQLIFSGSLWYSIKNLSNS